MLGLLSNNNNCSLENSSPKNWTLLELAYSQAQSKSKFMHRSGENRFQVKIQGSGGSQTA